MGDSISFNTIYRDRLVAWPIQDFPFEAVFFSHRNPIDPDAGFVPIPAKQNEAGAATTDVPSEGPLEQSGSAVANSGTEDLLLFRDLIEALALAFGQADTSINADSLKQGLLAVHLADGRLTLQTKGKLLFRFDGQRNGGTGENVVYLRPRFLGDRVLPEAVIEVWSRQASEGLTNVWNQNGKTLIVSYDEEEVYGARPHGGD